jgi:TonB-linked SusC/RagA family outer membrane protein
MKKIRSFLERDLLKKVKSGGRKILTGLFIALEATFLCASVSMAQDSKSVRGAVTDAQNQPLPGVNVIIKGTMQGTITDVDGNYQIQATAEDFLQFSFVGFESVDVLVGDQTTIDVSLKEKMSDLDEVVVVGYGVQQKSLVTGAISSVNAETLENTSNTNVEQAMQGRTAGVTVLPTSGAPGAGAQVRIRGTNSNESAEPLYIVDGMKVNNIDNIEPGNIESIEVLKDAASSAIYGSEGGNGVVIITTKTGEKGKGRISYDFQYALQNIDTEMELMNAEEYAQYMKEQGQDITVPSGIGKGTDWLDEIFEDDAPMQRHFISFSGGSETSSYMASASYNVQDGAVGGDKAKYKRFSFRLNSSHDINKWLEVGNTFTYSHSTRNTIGEDDEYRGVLNNALLIDPTTPVYYEKGQETKKELDALADGHTLLTDDQGRYYALPVNVNGEIGNPVAKMLTYNNETTIDKLLGTLYANLDPLKGLTISSRLGLDLSYENLHVWNKKYYFSNESNNGTNTMSDQLDKRFNWLWENFATFDTSLGDHNMTFLLGFSLEERQHPDWYLFSGPMAQEGDQYAYHDYATSRKLDVVGGDLEEEKMNSVFGRFSYNYLGKYLLQGSVRRDAASVFSEDDRSAVFPAASIGWIVSEEDFWGDGFLDYFKFRGSWGQNGSTSILTGTADKELWTASGIFYPTASEGGYYSGSQIDRLVNEDLKWERTEQLSVGIDMRFLKRINFSVDYYDKKTKDLIVLAMLPLSCGSNVPYVNGGDVSNSGFEFELGYNNQFGNLNLSVSANLSTLKNEVTSLDQDAPIAGANVRGYDLTWFEEGEPIWYFSGYKTNGIDPETGMPIVVDVSGDGKITSADLTKIGDPHPDFLYGANLAIDYKGLDFKLFLQGTHGNDIYTAWYRPDRATSNKPKYFYTDRWTPSHTNASMPKANGVSEYIFRSDLMVQDGSYMRIKQIQLGYSLPKSLIEPLGITRTRVFISLDDYFTFTDYKGLDPEAGSTNGQSQGVDRGVYPIPKKMMFGLSVNF